MSTVIKAGQASKVLQRLTTVDLADHLAEAHAVIADAQLKAAQLLARADREAARAADESRREGYDEGFKKGYAEGTVAGRAEALEQAMTDFEQRHADVRADFRRVIEEIDATKEERNIAASRNLLEFALTLARRLTFAIGEVYREAAVENLKRALEIVGARTDLCIRVHPKDVETMTTFASSTLEHLGASSAARVIADDTVAPGGCFVQTGSTEVDATLESQIEEIVSLLLGRGVEHG